MNQEVEIKLKLSNTDYINIIKNAKLLDKEEQVNIYFDNDWFLETLGGSCRIRLMKGKDPKFTLKTPLGEETDGARTSLEFEILAKDAFLNNYSILIRKVEKNNVVYGVQKIMDSLGIFCFNRVGWMKNTRKVVELSKGNCFEIDCFKLPNGQTQYEIEIENSNKNIRKVVLQDIKTIIPSLEHSELSKYQTFAKALKNK